MKWVWKVSSLSLLLEPLGQVWQVLKVLLLREKVMTVLHKCLHGVQGR